METNLELLTNLLVKSQVQYAFGVTGSGPSWDLITRLEEKGVTYTPASHEASAVIMAGAVSRLKHEPSISITIKGPGLANSVGGLASNYFECAPSINISEAYGVRTPISENHKRLHHKAILSSLVKARITLNHVENSFERLLDIGRREIPGPVHIDLAEGNTDDDLFPSEMKAAQSLGSLKLFAKSLNKSRRPILIAGSLATRRCWGKQFADFHIPILTTVSAKGAIDESNPYSAGPLTGAGKEFAPENTLLQKADLIIGIGLRSNEILKTKPYGKPTIIFDEVFTDFSKGFGEMAFIDCSKTEIMDETISFLKPFAWGLDLIRTLHEKLKNRYITNAWLPSQCFETLNRLSHAYGFVLDTGSFCTIGEHLWKAKSNRKFLGSSHGRFMGTSLPTAIGCSICHPELAIYCIFGDGGIRMYTAEIKLAVEKKLPICFILMMDGYYGSIACVPQERPMSKTAIKIPQPSWVKSVEGMGCPANSVSSIKEFDTNIEQWDRKGPLFIEASFDGKAYAQMTEGLR